jgi:hypothetical protein
MPFYFRCPHCETETWIEPQFCGKTGPCAVCGRLVTVPYADQLAAQPLPVESAIRIEEAANPTFAQVVTSRLSSRFRARVAMLALALFAIAILTLVVTAMRPLMRYTANASQLSSGRRNIEKIVAAMRQYQAEHGTLPPPYLNGPDGKPAHSWRVLILPYLGYKNLYDRYDFNSAWDSTNNKMLLREMPPVFAAPTDQNARDSYETSYMVVVGKKTAFPRDGGVTTSQIGDAHDRTILVVEVRSNGVTWMEPTDLDYSKMSFAANTGTSCPGTRHPTDFQAGFVDGVARNIPTDTSPEEVNNMLTTNGGEEVLALEN